MKFALEPLRASHFPSTGALSERIKPAQVAGRTRLVSIDLLRGLVMVVMALDHTRDFFAADNFNPRDVTDPALFLTRWITHFCAPTFILLAGMSAFLYGVGRQTGEVSRYLFTRGCWLVLIEVTVVRVAWSFNFHFDHLVLQVIFAIGASMIILAAIIHMPRWAIATVGVVMIAGHNMLDGVKAEQLGAAAPIWNLLHQPGLLDLGTNLKLFVLYPLIPWIGVMATGYSLGPLFMMERAIRVQRLVILGGAITAGFVILRATNLYGDPTPWAVQSHPFPTLLSFINCEKYPPSLLFLAMTLGPALLLLAAFERARGFVVEWITTFGRVPFFYYVAHIFLIHALAIVFAWATIGEAPWLLGAFPPQKPVAYGLGLAGIYTVWVLVLITLYPVCRWFADVKRRRTEWWLSYL